MNKICTSLIYDENDELLFLAFECGFEEDEFILNEFTINTGFGSWNFTVYGNGSEGPIPHFHLKKNGLDRDACFCLFEPKYFSHDSHQGMLSPKDQKNLDKVLNMKVPNDNNNFTVWEKLVSDWVTLNESFKTYSGIIVNKKPNYSKLNYYNDQHPAASPLFKKPATHGKKIRY